MKGQPLAYNKDNQEDKEPLFDTADTLRDTLAIFADMIDRHPRQARSHARRAAAGLRHRHRPGRLPGQARPALPRRARGGGLAVRAAEEKGCDVSDLTLDELKSFSPLVDESCSPC
jgi:argininosuccinate lyase